MSAHCLFGRWSQVARWGDEETRQEGRRISKECFSEWVTTVSNQRSVLPDVLCKTHLRTVPRGVANSYPSAVDICFWGHYTKINCSALHMCLHPWRPLIITLLSCPEILHCLIPKILSAVEHLSNDRFAVISHWTFILWIFCTHTTKILPAPWETSEIPNAPYMPA